MDVYGKVRFEPPHDKTNNVDVRPAKTQISLGIRPVWSESSLCAQWVAKDPSFLHADSEDSDQTGRMPRLIWVFVGRTVILLVLSRGGSFLFWNHGNFYKLFLPRTPCRDPNQSPIQFCKNCWRQSFKNWLKFAIVLFQRETLSVRRNFNSYCRLLRTRKKTKCCAGDFIDSQRSFRFYVQIPDLFKN